MNQPPSGGSKPGLMGPPLSHGLSRYGSAPGSFLAGIAESVISSGGAGGGGGRAEYSSSVGSEAMMSRFFPGDSSCLTSESSGRVVTSAAASGGVPGPGQSNGPAPPGIGLQRSYGLEEFHAAADLAAKSGSSGYGPALVRHSSLPAGFFSHIVVDQGPSTTRGIENYSQPDPKAFHSLQSRRLRTQWSFSRQDSLSQISELSIPEIEEDDTGNSSDEGVGPIGRSCITNNFQLGSWDDSNSIVFSAPPSKRPKDNNRDIVTTLRNIETQFSLPKTSSEMSSDKYLQIHHDAVPCRVRAKRGCATHPRSIAERERRTRISKRLRKLQDLVPNMDKQTSTSDMLELAIQHIKELQNKIEKIKEEQANCTCGSRQKP